jgi:hypothetical protein
LRAPAISPISIRVVAFSALLVCTRSLFAQRNETSIDIGGMALQYADTVNTGAAAVSGDAAFQARAVAAEAVGTFSQFFTGGSSAQGVLSGSYFIRSGSRVLTELGAFAGGSAHHDGTRTGQVLGNFRFHYQLAVGELFAGAGAGRSSFGDGAQNVFIGEAGASRQISGVDASFVLSPVAVDSAKYADAQLSASWTHANLDFSALAGFRLGDQLESLGGTARGWGSFNLVAWLKPGLAAVLGAGSYPIDPTQGFPGGRFASASIRFARGHRRQPIADAPLTQVPIAESGEPAAIKDFAWARAGARNVTLKATVTGGRSVEVSGDFTGWVPMKLTTAGNGVWTVDLPVAPGQYQMNMRINGGKWIVPPGLLPMVDEFGGAVGLLIVE